MSWGTALLGAQTALGFINARSANDRAGDSLAMQQQGIDETMRVNSRLESIYDEGANTIYNTINNALNAYGDFGSPLPDRFNDIYDFISTNRAEEEAANTALVGDGYDTLVGEVGFMNNMDANSIYAADSRGRANAPQTLDYAPLVDNVAQKFIDARTGNSSREISKAYGRALANIPAGLENSTLRVQMERSLADLAAQKQNEDMLAGIDDAFRYIGGLQTTSKNQQGMTNTEREIEANLLGNVFGRRNSNMDYYNTARFTPIEYTNALNSMRNDTAVADYNTALSLAGTENEFRNSGLQQFTNLATAPYDYSSSGLNSLSTNLANTNTGLAAMTNTTADIAKSASSGFGYSLDSLIKRLS